VKEEDGVFYPDWGKDGEIPLEFDWQGLNYTISNGKVT
jgi:hypothetical protein